MYFISNNYCHFISIRSDAFSQYFFNKRWLMESFFNRLLSLCVHRIFTYIQTEKFIFFFTPNQKQIFYRFNEIATCLLDFLITPATWLFDDWFILVLIYTGNWIYTIHNYICSKICYEDVMIFSIKHEDFPLKFTDYGRKSVHYGKRVEVGSAPNRFLVPISAR